MLDKKVLNDAYERGGKLGNKIFDKLIKDVNIDTRLANVGISSYKMAINSFKVMSDHDNKARKTKSK